MTHKSVHSFNIVRYRGQPTKVTVKVENKEKKVEWIDVYRMDKLFDPRSVTFIPTAPYDDHFVYELPSRIPGPRWRCTCGSIAGYVGSNVYAHDASPQGAMIVCLFHAQNGVHTNTQTRWV